jgi:putative ABC transport system substrate-binding protein
LRNGLRDLGWREGRDIAFEWRTAHGNDEQVPAIIAELLRSGVDLLALSGNNIVEPAMQLTKTVPIVMLASTSPLESGLVRSLSRPGGNVTGMTLNSQPDLVGKRLELLKEAAPGIRSVALLHDGITRELEEARAQANRVGLRLFTYPVDGAQQLDEAMRNAAQRRVDAVSVETSYLTAPAAHPEIRKVVERYRLPMIHRFREAVTGGYALMSYAPDPVDDYRRACVIIDRVLRGAKPGEIPIEVANKFYLDLNLQLAEAIGWKIPASVVARADTIIR